jgi:pimeloyl-ACP methyl ester carboxylesterase
LRALWLQLLIALVARSIPLSGLPLTIDKLEAIDINGTMQWILIRSSDALNPILLYLHGGPGHSLIPFAHVATSQLTDRFTVVYWDQRGAGLSYEAGLPEGTLNVRQLVEDTVATTEYLRGRFGKEKIYLLGHSWGSTLGSLAVQEKPELFAAYVGVGQVVNQRSLYEGRLAWLTTVMRPLLSYKDRNDIPC